jgi:YgiT-type zinc finger domain-containing protein
MQTEQADLKARLLAQAETVFEQLLEQKAGRRDLSLSEMEDLVGTLEVELRQAVMQTLVEESQAEGPGLCPACGGKLRHKGKRRKQVVTVRGEVTVERDYYVCTECGAGHFPPG